MDKPEVKLLVVGPFIFRWTSFTLFNTHAFIKREFFWCFLTLTRTLIIQNVVFYNGRKYQNTDGCKKWPSCTDKTRKWFVLFKYFVGYGEYKKATEKHLRNRENRWKYNLPWVFAIRRSLIFSFVLLSFLHFFRKAKK